jgi:hypothetical protein
LVVGIFREKRVVMKSNVMKKLAQGLVLCTVLVSGCEIFATIPSAGDTQAQLDQFKKDSDAMSLALKKQVDTLQANVDALNKFKTDSTESFLALKARVDEFEDDEDEDYEEEEDVKK